MILLTYVSMILLQSLSKLNLLYSIIFLLLRYLVIFRKEKQIIFGEIYIINEVTAIWKTKRQNTNFEKNELSKTINKKMSKQFKKFNFNASFGGDAEAKAEAGEAEQPPEKKQATSPSAQTVRSPSYKFKKFNFDASKGYFFCLKAYLFETYSYIFSAMQERI